MLKNIYKVSSIMIPENYIVIITTKDEFNKIIKENYSDKSKAIIYSVDDFKYLIDTKSNIVIQTKEK